MRTNIITSAVSGLRAIVTMLALVASFLFTPNAFAQKGGTDTGVAKRGVPFDVAIRGYSSIVSYLFQGTDQVQLFVAGKSVAGMDWKARSKVLNFDDLKRLGYRPGEYETFQKAIRTSVFEHIEPVPVNGTYEVFVNIYVTRQGMLTFRGAAWVEIVDDGVNLTAKPAVPYLYLDDTQILVTGSNLSQAMISLPGEVPRWINVDENGDFVASVADFNTGTLVGRTRGVLGDSGAHAISVDLGHSVPVIQSGRFIDLLFGATTSDDFFVVGDGFKLPDVTFWAVPRYDYDSEAPVYGRYPLLVYTPVKDVELVNFVLPVSVYRPQPGRSKIIIPDEIEVKDVRRGTSEYIHPDGNGKFRYVFHGSSYQLIPHFEGVAFAIPKG